MVWPGCKYCCEEDTVNRGVDPSSTWGGGVAIWWCVSTICPHKGVSEGGCALRSWQKLENLVKSWIFCLIWHGTQKIRKNEKTQHLSRKSNSKLILRILSIFDPVWTKSGKKLTPRFFFFFFFCDFLKNCEFWSKFDITNVFLVKLPFWKCILICTFMNLLRSYVSKLKYPNVTCSPP